MDRKMVYLLLALCIVILGSFLALDQDNQANSSDIPDPYYIKLKQMDIYNPDDIIRYDSSIKSHTTDLGIFERAAFYEWYFKSHGSSDVTFAYSDDFKGKGISHLWLLYRTPKGETIEVDPSYREMGIYSMVPLDPKYTMYEKEFKNIYEACKHLGIDELEWWNDRNAGQILEDNLLIMRKRDAMNTL